MHNVTIFISGYEPCIYDLDSFGKNYVALGRGMYHGNGSLYNDIPIPDEATFVSRRQCCFSFENGSWIIHDEGSKNGIIFQNSAISSRVLRDGDRLRIGSEKGPYLLLVYSERVIQDSTRDGVYALPQSGYFTIGRSERCNVVINHPTVSACHCYITYSSGVYYIEDNHSANGVIFNGTLLRQKMPLNQMDSITICGCTFVFFDNCLFYSELKGGVDISVEHMSKRVGKGKKLKTIADDITLNIHSNEFVAIVGGSGAGKTTLLNCISGISGFTEGDVFINGESLRRNPKSLRSMIGYVPQKDIVYDDLSLERMLYYSAKLRMPGDTTEQEIRDKIEETLNIVELEAHRKTLISKLSGGQKKRASIAVELLASPKLFFLDEPSSGLDPGTEKHLVQMLKKLSMTGKTVVMVTHNVQNINLCDRVICMGNGGKLCFSGSPDEALRFFGVNSFTDIFDTLSDYAVPTADAFAHYSGAYQTGLLNGMIYSVSQKSKRAPLKSFLVSLRQFGVMTVRYLEIFKNSLPRLALLFGMPILLAILVCIAFQADGNLYNIFGKIINRKIFPFLVATDTMSIIFAFSCAAFWVGIFNSVQEISKEREIYNREHFTGVKIGPYIMSKVAVLTLLCLLQTLLMCGIFFFMNNTVATINGDVNSVTALPFGMGENGVVFGSGGLKFEWFITSFLTVLSAMCVGLVVSSLVSNDMAIVLCPVCLLPQILFSGVIGSLSGLTETLSRIITCRWSCIAFFTSADINNLYGSCEYQNADGWLTKAISTESGIIDVAYDSSKTYVFGLDPVRSSWLILLASCIICIVLCVLILRIKDHRSR